MPTPVTNIDGASASADVDGPTTSARQRMNELRRDDLDARFPGLLEVVLAGR
jgi:hypothetical protein